MTIYIRNLQLILHRNFTDSKFTVVESVATPPDAPRARTRKDARPSTPYAPKHFPLYLYSTEDSLENRSPGKDKNGLLSSNIS